MCQAGALAATLLPGTEGLLPLLVGLEEVSAGRAVRPGETLELSAVPGRRSGPLVIAVLEARVDGSPVASGTARVAFAPSEEATER
jgi:3-hydroxymyristoyl/3-hydroxydecanoyl-(acyl carrier protein) dehydratase